MPRGQMLLLQNNRHHLVNVHVKHNLVGIIIESRKKRSVKYLFWTFLYSLHHKTQGPDITYLPKTRHNSTRREIQTEIDPNYRSLRRRNAVSKWLQIKSCPVSNNSTFSSRGQPLGQLNCHLMVTLDVVLQSHLLCLLLAGDHIHRKMLTDDHLMSVLEIDQHSCSTHYVRRGQSAAWNYDWFWSD